MTTDERERVTRGHGQCDEGVSDDRRRRQLRPTNANASQEAMVNATKASMTTDEGVNNDRRTRRVTRGNGQSDERVNDDRRTRQ